MDDMVVRSALQTNLLMQFRTGNLIWDSIIGLCIASCTMYLFRIQQPLFDYMCGLWTLVMCAERCKSKLTFTAQVRPGRLSGDVVTDTFVAITFWLVEQIQNETLTGVKALKEVPLRKQLRIFDDGQQEWSKSLLLLDQRTSAVYHHTPHGENHAHVIRVLHNSESIETDDCVYGQKQKVSNQVHSITFQSPTLSVRDLTDFVDGIVEAYKETQRRASSGELNYFLYRSLLPSDDDSGGAGGTPDYDTYRWRTTKRYEHVVSKHTTTIQTRVDHFLNNREWFSTHGKPYSLTFLLHGPPGCGKTSIIKAVANATKRHIKEIPLPRVHSRLALMEIFHGTHKADGGLVRPDDCIYVFEEFDKLGKLVNKVDGGGVGGTADSESSLGPTSDQWVAAATVASIASTMAAADGSGTTHPCPPTTARTVEPPLQLGDILNVMDGLLEHDGTITFYTANDITHLHDAITRPGRVDMILHFDYATADQCCAIVRSAFDLAGGDGNAKLEPLRQGRAALDKKLSPAKIEEICTACDTVEKAVDQILVEAAGVNKCCNI